MDGHEDRGSTPLASTNFIINELQMAAEACYNNSYNNATQNEWAVGKGGSSSNLICCVLKNFATGDSSARPAAVD